MRKTVFRTALTLACMLAIGGHARAATYNASDASKSDLGYDFGPFSISTGSPCSEMVSMFRRADARLIRSALAVADAVEDRDQHALARACDDGRQSVAEARQVLVALDLRCPRHADVVRTNYSAVAGDYAPATLLLARCD